MTLKRFANVTSLLTSRSLKLLLLGLAIGTQAVQAQTYKTLYSKDFGTGAANSTSTTPLTNLSPGSTDYTAITTYGSSTTVQDGQYAITTNSMAGGTGFNIWLSGNDHTTGTGTGYLMLVNADYRKIGPVSGTIIEIPISVKMVPGATYRVNVWAANLLIYTASDVYSSSNTNGHKEGYLGIGVYTSPNGGGTNLSTNLSYTLPRAASGATALPWYEYSPSFTLPTTLTGSQVYFDIYNSDPWSTSLTNPNYGNDFVIDDISLELNTIILSGTIYTDPNWNGTGMSAYAPGTGIGISPLHVVLVDKNYTVVSVANVNSSDGT